MIAYVSVNICLVPSKNQPGKFNVKRISDGMFASVDPNGVVTWSTDNVDKNYQQFTRNGVMLEIAPGDDNNPFASRYVLLPTDLA